MILLFINIKFVFDEFVLHHLHHLFQIGSFGSRMMQPKSLNKRMRTRSGHFRS